MVDPWILYNFPSFNPRVREGRDATMRFCASVIGDVACFNPRVREGRDHVSERL